MRNFQTVNYIRCLIAVIFCTLIISFTFIGIITGLLNRDASAPLTGITVFRYFTVLSALFINACAILCVPFSVNGLITRNYHLPRWIVTLLYIGVTCTTVTFIICALVFVPSQGLYKTFLAKDP